MSDTPPDRPRPRNDEMDPDQYEYPPGLMPNADAQFRSVKGDNEVTVYQTDNDERYITADRYVYPFK